MQTLMQVWTSPLLKIKWINLKRKTITDTICSYLLLNCTESQSSWSVRWGKKQEQHTYFMWYSSSSFLNFAPSLTGGLLTSRAPAWTRYWFTADNRLCPVHLICPLASGLWPAPVSHCTRTHCGGGECLPHTVVINQNTLHFRYRTITNDCQL